MERGFYPLRKQNTGIADQALNLPDRDSGFLQFRVMHVPLDEFEGFEVAESGIRERLLRKPEGGEAFGWVVEPGTIRPGDEVRVLALGEREVHPALPDKPL